MAAVADLRLRTRWKLGTAAGAPGPFYLSYTEFSLDRLADAPGIWRIYRRLSEELVAIEGAVGVLGYLQPAGRRRVGSLSAWTGEAGLAAFVALPYHREIMRRYRSRGALRSASWWADDLDRSDAFTRGAASVSPG
jgi:hypothetical protein